MREWTLLIDGEVALQSSDILDCIEERNGNEGRITDSFET